jgi:hypothetical protein
MAASNATAAPSPADLTSKPGHAQPQPRRSRRRRTAELVTFIRQWLGGTDHAQLAAPFGRFIGTQGYDLAELRTDLARFTFLLGHDDGEQLFGTGHS